MGEIASNDAAIFDHSVLLMFATLIKLKDSNRSPIFSKNVLSEEVVPKYINLGELVIEIFLITVLVKGSSGNCVGL